MEIEEFVAYIECEGTETGFPDEIRKSTYKLIQHMYETLGIEQLSEKENKNQLEQIALCFNIGFQIGRNYQHWKQGGFRR